MIIVYSTLNDTVFMCKIISLRLPKSWASLNGKCLISVHKGLTDREADSRRPFKVYTHKGTWHGRIAGKEQRPPFLYHSSKSKMNFVKKCYLNKIKLSICELKCLVIKLSIIVRYIKVF